MSAGSDIAAMTVQLDRDPSSLVFLSLGEALRRKGDLAAALPIAESGVAWYPEMAGAWDLLARVRSDRGEGDLAFEAWTTVLRFDPEHAGAHKGLAFLAYRAGEWDRSYRYLRQALELSPADPGLQSVLDRVREEAAHHASVPAPPSPLSPLELRGRALLVDLRGRLLEGCVDDTSGRPAPEEAGAALAGLSRDAERAVRLLGLGPWRRISLVGDSANLEIRSPTIDSLLLITGPGTTETKSLAGEADRVASGLGRWLEALR
ncbi:MAG TPA: hypothetical protein VJK71_06035 [Gemmatimonadales bacterium]|nr:hypothetical protein [Gemmatimonadales bacterium]